MSFKSTDPRPDTQNPVYVACELILKRCGPKKLGFENLGARSTGDAVRSAVVSFWRARGFDGDYVDLGRGAFSGNPGHARALSTLISRLESAQRAAGSNIVRRAYMETHEDLSLLYECIIRPHTLNAYMASDSVPWLEFLVVTVNTLQWTSAARADELLQLNHDDLRFTGTGIDAKIVASRSITKNNATTTTHFTFTKGLFACISGVGTMYRWLCVLKRHGIDSGPLFPSVVSNKLQKGTVLSHRLYGTTLAKLGRSVGLSQPLSEHSARRGGVSYYYYVLRWDLHAIYRAFKWESFEEMLNYLGVTDPSNSYALAGFTAKGTTELFYPK